MSCHVRSISAGRDVTTLSSPAPFSASKPQVGVASFKDYTAFEHVCIIVTDANPPVRLSCGHAISRDAMKKLVSHSRR